MMQKSKFLFGFLALGAILVLGGCGNKAATDSSNDTMKNDDSAMMQESMIPDGPVKIGISAPLTGEAASFGDGMKAGAELALKEINEAGGINGHELKLIFEDDKCNNKDGVNALTKLATVDKVSAIIGPLCSAAAGAGLPAVQRAGIPDIVFGSAPHLPSIGNYIFRIYPSDNFQGKFAAEYAYNTLGKRKAAILYVVNDWGQGLQEVFSKRFKELGGEVVFNEGVTQSANDLRTPITKLKTTEPDFIYFPAYPAVGAVGIKQFKDLNITVPIFGGDAFDTDEIIKTGYSDGVTYTRAVIGNPDEFKAQIEANNGVSNIGTPITYDALHIYADIIAKVGTNPEKIQEELVKLNYTEGISSPVINFDENGDLKQGVFEVMEIQNNTSKKIN